MLVADLAAQLTAIAQEHPDMPVRALVHFVSDHGGVRCDQWEHLVVSSVVVREGRAYLGTDDWDAEKVDADVVEAARRAERL